jgi:hypothetical protein
MYIDIDDKNAGVRSLGKQIQRRDGNIVERAEAGAMRAPGVVTAASGIAGNAVVQRHLRGEHRSTCGALRAQRDALRYGESDLAFNLGRYATGKHLIDIVRVVRPLQCLYRRTLRRDVDRSAKQSSGLEPLDQGAVLAHRKAMVRRKAGVVVAMAYDMQAQFVALQVTSAAALTNAPNGRPAAL